ncbi:hypothetical protein BJF79_35370 [Actinomadura sp. CNU-125]|nr:hypothetical protein BJF79_35370 [Actinomadura sp. CNU-125]
MLRLRRVVFLWEVGPLHARGRAALVLWLRRVVFLRGDVFPNLPGSGALARSLRAVMPWRVRHACRDEPDEPGAQRRQPEDEDKDEPGGEPRVRGRVDRGVERRAAGDLGGGVVAAGSGRAPPPGTGPGSGFQGVVRASTVPTPANSAAAATVAAIRGRRSRGCRSLASLT